jgi:6-phosphofructokinase
MGAASVQFLLDGKRKHMTGFQNNSVVPVDLEYASTTEKPLDERLYKLALELAT